MSLGYVTDPIEFIVQDLDKNSSITYNGKTLYEDCRWFKKTDGEKKGLQYVIPITHPEYSDLKERKLCSLSKYDTVVLKLKSINERNTAWICEEIVDFNSF